MNLWYSLDFETSTVNKYSCDIDRVCVAEFDINTGRTQQVCDFQFRSASGIEMLDPDLAILKQLMGNSFPKVAHNLDFDLYLMEERLKIKVNGDLHDTFMMAKHWRNDLPSYSLKNLSWYIFGDTYQPLLKLKEWFHHRKIKMGDEEIDDFDMTKPPNKLVSDYCKHDVIMTTKLAAYFYPFVKDNYAWQQDEECIPYNMKLQSAGFYVDKPFFKRMLRLCKRRMKRNKSQALDKMEITDGKSPTGNALKEHLVNLGEARRTKTGMVQADAIVLRDWKDDDVIKVINRVKDDTTIQKYSRAILEVCGDRDFFYPGLQQSAAITRRYKGRNFYSPDGPVVKGQTQNFPRGIGIRTGCIVPPDYWFEKLDLASIEARMGAHAMSVFLDEDWFSGQYRKSDKFNIYIHVGTECTGEIIKKGMNIYDAYKHGILGKQYGVGIKTLHKTLHDKFNLPYTIADVTEIYRTIDKKFPIFRKLQRAVGNLVEAKGFVYNDYGSAIYVPKNERYKGVNYYCQTTAGDVMKHWWTYLQPEVDKTDDFIFNTVHDEFDTAINKAGGKRVAKKRVKGYCDLTRQIDIFSLPIIAEPSGLYANWGEAG